MDQPQLLFDEIDRARTKLDSGPLCTGTLRAIDALQAPSMRERIIAAGANYIASNVVRNLAGRSLRFCAVSDDADWRGICALRKRRYPVSLPYLTDLLDDDGKDRYDRHSFVFAAFDGDRAVATIRATIYPYETAEYVDEQVLRGFLGPAWKTEYVEWSRLLVEPTPDFHRVAPALITYAGLRLWHLTQYRRYFGYTKPHVRSLLSRFALDSEMLRFQIPSRGEHSYLLLKGEFGASALYELPKWIGRAWATRGLSMKAA